MNSNNAKTINTSADETIRYMDFTDLVAPGLWSNVPYDDDRETNMGQFDLHKYWGFSFPWDFTDDNTKYRKEDAMRYLPLIAVMRIIVGVVSGLTLLIFVYLGFVLCLKKKRIFYAKETIIVVIFLTCITLSHVTFHMLAYLGLVWMRKSMSVWCSFITFFHLNYVLTICSFQLYVFIVAVSSNKPWLHNITQPILFLAGPVAAGCIDGMATSWINEDCDHFVFNLSFNITFLFIFLPCAINTLLVPIMAICTYTIVHQRSRLYGFVATFLFSSIHLGGGILLLMTATGEKTELQYYFQFCVLSITESFYQALLAVLLLILSNTNTSLIDRHCTYDIDTKTLAKYFEDPKSSIQLMQRKA